MTRRVMLTFATAAALIVAGCGSKKENTTASSPAGTTPTKTVGAPGAKVTLTSPADGSSVSGPVTAQVKVVGFELSPATVGMPAKGGQGHLHFSMDSGKYDQPRYSGPNGQLAVKLGVQGKYSPSVMPTITYKNLPPGKHKLEVYLANNDHTNTGVEAETEFTVK